MNAGIFIKDKLIFISLNLIVILFSAFLLYMVNAKFYFIIFVPATYLIGCILTLSIEFLLKNNYYKKVLYGLEKLENKCLISEVISYPRFYEGHILFDILKQTNKSMNDEIAKYSLISAEYREYIELWVHEIKTPIAGAKLICENTNNFLVVAELEKIDRFVEQALFYSRSNNVEKDFSIKSVLLIDLINGVLRKNAKYLIQHKITIEMEAETLKGPVFADNKWTDFIIEQIIYNSVKYRSSNIKFYSKEEENSTSLLICDNGMGIPSKDIQRVFEKGFTGENGRSYAKSTGIGLYLCKKMCQRLGLSIFLSSKQNKGTELEIVFPKSNMYL